MRETFRIRYLVDFSGSHSFVSLRLILSRSSFETFSPCHIFPNSSTKCVICQTETDGLSTCRRDSSFVQTTVGFTNTLILSALKKFPKRTALFRACLLGFLNAFFHLFLLRYSQLSPTLRYSPLKFFISITHTPGGPTKTKSKSALFFPGMVRFRKIVQLPSKA